jgi:hypothetical protein
LFVKSSTTSTLFQSARHDLLRHVPDAAIGFETIAGRNDELRRIVLHLHHREEILRTPMIFSRFELPDRLPDSSTP